MKQIITTIKSNREELISKYFAMKKEIEVLNDGIHQARKLNAEETYDKLWAKRADLNSKVVDLDMAINGLTNALNHLGENTETFWGE